MSVKKVDGAIPSWKKVAAEIKKDLPRGSAKKIAERLALKGYTINVANVRRILRGEWQNWIVLDEASDYLSELKIIESRLVQKYDDSLKKSA